MDFWRTTVTVTGKNEMEKMFQIFFCTCLFSLPVEIFINITCARLHVTSINGKVKKSDIFIRRLGGQQLMPKVLYSVYALLSYKVTII